MNGQSAAKALKEIIEQSSTTIPWKGSTTLKKLEKVDIKYYSFNDKLPNISCVYAILNIENLKLYIGSCKNLHKRKVRHYTYLKRNAHHSNKLQRSFNNDRNKFVVIILEECENVLEKEQFYLDLFESYSKGYNSTPNVIYRKPFKQSEEAKNKAIKAKQIKIVCLDLNGNFVREFEGVSVTAKYFNTQSTNISKCCKEY